MQGIIKTLVLLFLMSSVPASAVVERLGWNIIGSSSYIELSVNQDYVGSSLPIEATKNTNAVDLLSSYYFYAMQNDVLSLRKVHFEKDDTRTRFDKELTSQPTRFSGFKNLKGVKLGQMFIWGNYTAIEVEWATEDQKPIKWVELVSCEEQCFISDRLYKSNLDFQFFSSVMAIVKSQPATAKKIDGGVELCPASRDCRNPIRIVLPINKIKGVPFTPDVDVKNFNPPHPRYANLYTLMTAVWGAKPDDSPLGFHNFLKDLFQCCIASTSADALFPFFNMAQGESGKKTFSLEYLTPIALYEVLNKVKVLEIGGVIETPSADYVLTRLTTNSSTNKAMQMFLFEAPFLDAGMKVSAQPQDFYLHTILTYPGVVEYVDSQF